MTQEKSALLSTRWATRFLLTPDSGVIRDQFAPGKSVKLIVFRHLTFDERFVVHRVATCALQPNPGTSIFLLKAGNENYYTMGHATRNCEIIFIASS